MKPIENLSEFIEEIHIKIKALNDNDLIWFRGEASNKYELTPSLYRVGLKGKPLYSQKIFDHRKVELIEQSIDAHFDQRGAIFFGNKKIENNNWNRYFLKQHYKVKTRLLDWTRNALIALFFAIEEEKNWDKDARIWLLDPTRLNHFSLNKMCPKPYNLQIIMSCDNLEKEQDLFNEKEEIRLPEVLRRYYRLDCRYNPKLYPIAINPTHLDERMAAQQSCFTLFGNIMTLRCEEDTEPFLDCIEIAKTSKKSIPKDLSLLGISYYSVYPDLDGLGRTINYDFEVRIEDALTDNDLKTFAHNANQ